VGTEKDGRGSAFAIGNVDIRGPKAMEYLFPSEYLASIDYHSEKMLIQVPGGPNTSNDSLHYLHDTAAQLGLGPLGNASSTQTLALKNYRTDIGEEKSDFIAYVNEGFDIRMHFHLWNYYGDGTAYQDYFSIAENCRDWQTEPDPSFLTDDDITFSNHSEVLWGNVTLKRGRQYQICYQLLSPNVGDKIRTQISGFNVSGPNKLRLNHNQPYTVFTGVPFDFTMRGNLMDFEGDTYAFNPPVESGYQTWWQKNKVGPNNLKEGKFNQKMVFIMQHYEGPNSNYSHMSCNEAMKKLHFYYNPPYEAAAANFSNASNVTAVNITNNTNGTQTVLLSNGSSVTTNDTAGLL
jgi:hypothetical protein